MMLGEYIHNLTRKGVDIRFGAPKVFPVGMHVDMKFKGVRISKLISHEDFCMKLSEDQIILDVLKGMVEEINEYSKEDGE